MYKVASHGFAPCKSRTLLSWNELLRNRSLKNSFPITRTFSSGEAFDSINEQVVVGLVTQVEKHPNADRLNICTVNIGEDHEGERNLTIVCGASNVGPQQHVAVALPGAKLSIPDIEENPFKDKGKNRTLYKSLNFKSVKIKKSKVRGQQSSGMICALRELGYLSSLDDGIWVIENEEAGQRLGLPVPKSWVGQSSIEDERKSFKNLIKEWNMISTLSQANALLAWDQQVYMPQGQLAAESRGMQMSGLSSLIHKHSTSSEYESYLNDCMKKRGGCLNGYESRSVELAYDELKKAKSTPTELVAELSRLQSKTFSAWSKAKEKGKFSIVQSSLNDLLQAAIEVEKTRKQDSDESLYSSMLSNYVKGTSESALVDIFSYLKQSIVPLSQSICSTSKFSQQHESSRKLLVSGEHSDTYSIEAQKDLSLYVLKAMGFSDASMRTDVSAHPFTICISPGADVRITSRFLPYNAESGLMATVHEMGHALYERNLMSSVDTPLNSFLDLAAHESQSLFWERMIAQSKPFVEWVTPRIKQNFAYGNESSLDQASVEDFYRSLNTVKPNLIRVDADEVHYPLHVIIRFEIERELVNGTLEVKSIPERWNHLYYEYFGIAPENDREGCLQDVHWFSGAFGYFPSYTLGAIYAAQLHRQAIKDIPDLEDLTRQGDFTSLQLWLANNIHRWGAYPKSMNDLCQTVTGEGLRPELFVEYLSKKYLEE